MLISDWAALVRAHFPFLEEHGFQLKLQFSRRNRWGTRAVFASETAAIAVDMSVEFQRAEIFLARLTNGAYPGVRVFVTGEPFEEVLFDNVVEARAPERPNWKTVAGTTYEENLRFWADALLAVAPEFLSGDFSAIEDGERCVRARMAMPRPISDKELMLFESFDQQKREVEAAGGSLPEHIQRIWERYDKLKRDGEVPRQGLTVWVAADMTDQQVEEQIAKARQTVPPEAQVTIERLAPRRP